MFTVRKKISNKYDVILVCKDFLDWGLDPKIPGAGRACSGGEGEE